MLFTVLIGLITSSLIVPFGKFIKTKWGIILAAIPLLLFLYYLQYIPLVNWDKSYVQHIEWIPSLGVNFDFRLDGLSLLFTLLITGIGTCIFIYAKSYLKNDPYIDRFFGYLCMFMSAMLGLVLSDNIFLLFTFWELTSISSFFLIGFNNEKIASRKSALTALSVTGLGGFFLLAGLVLIGNIAGTYSISELVSKAQLIQDHYLYPYILGLILLGAMTKSAQFPFHFWLPGAMKAPTPVSAYLHSATMVKAGIYLLARFFPILGSNPAWTYSLMLIGGITMLYGAFHSLFRTDMKGVLAYSTISALGILVFLLGIGTEEAIIAAAVFIVVHALYKATLFLITGIIDHEAHTRDLTVLSGLRKVLLPVAIAGFLAAISSAGVPLTFGFIGKDLIYEATLNSDEKLAIYLTSAAVLTNILLVSAGFMAGIKPFMGPIPESFKKIQLPEKSLWIPPLLLALLGLVFGCFPSIIGDWIAQPTVNGIMKINSDFHLKIWHGFNTVLLLSALTIILGTLVYFINQPSQRKLLWIEKLNFIAPQSIFQNCYKAIYRFSTSYSHYFHDGYLRSYLLKIIIFAEVLLAYQLYLGGPLHINWDLLSAISVYEVVTILIVFGAVALTLSTSSRLTAVVSTSVIGYGICLLFVFYSAPDLAMTQFTIDTLTVVLFVLVLFKLPPFLNLANKKVLIRDIIVAVIFGVILAMVAIRALHVPTNIAISEFYGSNAYLLAKGRNVVNVLLVDFRGFDTMFEIVVLTIAALGVYSLLKLRLKSSEKE
ncbi:putative monovalent cation/H+ antiporter subunit A [Sphingobacterium sp. SG20118]|uniref:putative monovalent cation/H+ antiporter subunit A n=1 Tax=Sphingobacterium TaxID=28453 RepID=UPI0004F63EA3|nr:MULTISPECIES: putative monovalent cation/H+ antiporter subunit A [Sphingobacterium]AIM38727.1 cation:proton antiporter [Sphingobacterium sp. ML3W]MDH5825296.1 putative monovalent cation/H+ antiporter subunit A [Sphingobacterium faecium]